MAETTVGNLVWSWLFDPRLGKTPVADRWPSLHTSPAFEELRSHSTSGDVETRLDYALRHVALMWRREDVLAAFAALSMIASLVIACMEVFGLLNRSLLDSPLDGSDLQRAAFTSTIWLVLGLPLVLAAVRAFRRAGASLLVLGLGVAIANLGAAALVFTGEGVDQGKFTVVLAVAALDLLVAISFITGVAFGVLDLWVTVGSHRANPGAHVLVALADAVETLGSPNPTTRHIRSALASIETAAVVLGSVDAGLIHPSVGDPDTRAWASVELRRRASGLRRMKRQLLLSGAGDTEEVARRCGSLLVAATNGWWADFPAAEPVPRARSSRYQTALRALAAGGLPLAGVAAWNQWVAKITGEERVWVWGAAALWALISLVVLLDPDALEKLAALRDVRGLRDRER